MQFVTLIIKPTFCASFLSLAVISFPPPSLAVTVEEVPNPRQVNHGWVTDMANVLNPSTEAKLNQLISALEAKNGSEIAVVTVPETAPAKTPKEFTTALFNHWKIGKADQDNGVLFLISKSDRRVEIETGYGVEKILPNARVGNIIQQEITPRLKQGDYNGGTLAGTKALVTALEGEAYSSNALTPTQGANTQTSSPKAVTDSSTDRSNKPGLPLGGLGLIGLGMLSGLVLLLARAGRNKDDDDNGGSRGGRRGGRRRHRSSTSTGSTSTSTTNTGSTSTSSANTGSTSTGGGSFGGGSSGGGGAGGSY
jgi:uncharacterized protein